MPDEAAFLPGLGEGGVGDLVLVDCPQEDGEVVVAVWEWSGPGSGVGWGGRIPIKGVVLRMRFTLFSMDCEWKQWVMLFGSWTLGSKFGLNTLLRMTADSTRNAPMRLIGLEDEGD